MLHISVDGGQAEMRHHAAQLLHPFFIRGDLRAQVSNILVNIAGRVFGTGQAGTHVGLKHHAPLNQLDVIQHHALVLDRA